MATIVCKNCGDENVIPAMRDRFPCIGCNQPIDVPKASAKNKPTQPTPRPPENEQLLRDAVRSLRIIAMFVGMLVGFGAALAFGGEGDDVFTWLRRGVIFWVVMLATGWVALTRKRIV